MALESEQERTSGKKRPLRQKKSAPVLLLRAPSPYFFQTARQVTWLK